MRESMIRLSIVLCLVMMHSLTAIAETGRWEQELSGPGWQLWLDKDAEWRFDTAYLPPVDLDALPVNPPSCGWEGLETKYEKVVTVPGTVEEHYWGANGNPLGIAGDYRGVSWWRTFFTLDNGLAEKRITLRFAAVNLRAEIFVNRQFVGYDTIGNTPFEVDITDAVEFGGINRLDVRITDPVGNFTWEDNDIQRWGPNHVPAVHGFGGITGKVFIRATDPVYIKDIYVENKPSVTDAEFFVTVVNDTGGKKDVQCHLAVESTEEKPVMLFSRSEKVTLQTGETVIPIPISAPDANPWSIRNGNLYEATVEVRSDDTSDRGKQHFGFRYFTVSEKDGDRRFYLNGKRVFIFAAMTRGFWPKNGMTPTGTIGLRDIGTALKLGFNTMLFHRAIGQNEITDLCDVAGLLVYQEPGGYRCTPEPTPQAREWRREKLRRMVIRDRSRPSMAIYNLKNEADRPPSDDDIENMQLVHSLDPGRVITYNSDRNRDIPYNERINPDPYKLHMLPFDDTLYYHGWIDHHHWFAWPGYVDTNYNNPRYYLRGVIDAPRTPVPADSLNRLPVDEIIFWGEEGQWGTMPRLEKDREIILEEGGTGFREEMILSWYDRYDTFLDQSGFRESFPTVDDLTMSMGRSLHYFHGRSLENVRMGNISDGYNLNGWAAPETAEDIVDLYRFPTADPNILAYYSQPLYIAVKLRDKVLPVGHVPIADFYIINETDVRGDHTLLVTLRSRATGKVFEQTYPVTIEGGEQYGQLLLEEITLPAVEKAGNYTLQAILFKGTEQKGENITATGFDDIFAVDWTSGPGISGSAAVIDTSGVINDFLREARGIELPAFDSDSPDVDLIVIGPHDYRAISAPHNSRYINAVMDRVHNGATCIILDQADRWAQNPMNNLYTHASIDFKRHVRLGNEGRFIVGSDPVMDGLPQDQAMHWEYQTFYRGNVSGLDLTLLGTDPIVCLAVENRPDIYQALTRIPYGRGQVYLSTLDIIPGLASDTPQSATAKKLFLNLLERSNENREPTNENR